MTIMTSTDRFLSDDLPMQDASLTRRLVARVFSPTTGHFVDCPTYCTLDDSDCTCWCVMCDALGAYDVTIGSFTSACCDQHAAAVAYDWPTS